MAVSPGSLAMIGLPRTMPVQIQNQKKNREPGMAPEPAVARNRRIDQAAGIFRT